MEMEIGKILRKMWGGGMNLYVMLWLFFNVSCLIFFVKIIL